MGYSSQSGQVGFGIQSVRGTPVAATRFAQLRSGSLGGDRQLLIPDPEIGGNRDIPRAYMGPVSFSGDLEFYPRMQMLALLLRAALGSASSVTGGTAVNEVQSLATTGTPTGGTFKLRYRGETTGTIVWNSSAAAVITALNALASVSPGDFVGTGGPLPTAVTLTAGASFAGKDIPLIVTTEAALTGGTTPTVAVTTTTPGTATWATHTIVPTDTLPWMSVEERVGNEFDSYRYTDCKVNTLHLEAEAQGYLMGSANIIGLTQVASFTEQTTPAWDNSPMFVGQQISITFGGVTLPVKSFSLDITNNIESDDFNMGSVFAADMTEKRREVKASFSYRPQDALLWRGAMYGATGLTAPAAGPAYKGDMAIIMTTVETVGDVASGTAYACRFDIPVAAMSPFKVTPSGDDVIQTDIEVTAIRPDALVPVITATIVDDLATVT